MITFENIKTGEVVHFTGNQDPNTRQAHMAAYLNSSDLSVNAGIRGQDFGWRLAPEIVAKIDEIKTDISTLETISKRVGVGIDDIRDFHILNYIAELDFAKEALQARAIENTPVHAQSYNARLEALKTGTVAPEAPVVTPLGPVDAPVVKPISSPVPPKTAKK